MLLILPVTWHKWRIERALPTCLKMNNLVISYSRKRRARKKKSEQVPVDVGESKKACQFCLSDEDCEVNYGTIFEKEDVMVHYFCMLLSSGLCQNAKVSDKKSILGFTLSDIKKELYRGSRLKCCFCRQRGATIGCCIKSCRKVFHLSCGREHGTMHQFFDSFRSYCDNHRLEQVWPKKKPTKTCSICFCTVTSDASCDTLMPPCCQKSLFHRQCMQQYSLSAGMHYFKCPLCNSVEEFQMDMRTYGIYIPDQDASWEREPNAFEELLERHNCCDVSECSCPQGRQFDADSGKYELLLCGWCGAFGSHRACKGLVWRGVHLICCDCAEIIDKVESKQEQEKSNQEKLSPHTPRSRKRACLQKELDEQSPTCSAARRLMESPRDQSWLQNDNSPVVARKRQCINSLQFQSPASLREESDDSVQKQNTLFQDSSWKWTAESYSQSRQQGSRDNLRQRSTGQQMGRPKRSEIATFCISNLGEWDSCLFDCRVVLTKADRQINDILRKEHSLKNHSKMGQREGSYTNMNSRAGRFTGNTKTLASQQINNPMTVTDTNTVEANSGSEESLPDLTNMHDFSETCRGIVAERSPPVIKPGICWQASPQKRKQRRSYCVTVSELDCHNVGEILVGEAVYPGWTCGDQVVSSTADDFQLVIAEASHVDASPASAIASHNECGINECTTTAQLVSEGTSTMIALRFQVHQLCKAVTEDITNIQETVQEDSNSFLHSSAGLNSPPLLPGNENQNVDCSHQNTDMRKHSPEKVTLTYLDKMLMQTDIFGQVVMLDSSHKKRRMSKSKDSSAFLRLSQSKIEHFLITK